jgi:hypothetical protein
MYFAPFGNEIIVLGKVVIWFVMYRAIYRTAENRRRNLWLILQWVFQW